MHILGIDFTSAPRRSKPITCAVCHFSDDLLTVDSLLKWPGFDGFEAILKEDGDWVAGVDFPLGQPRRLVEALQWPKNWTGYVERVAAMSKTEFVDEITAYCDQQPKGDKHHLRRTDELCRSCSPMMLYGVPVGKMFYEGAPRVLRSGACVLPCRPNDTTRVVVEAYPALVARRLIGRTPYKNEKKGPGGSLAPMRRELIKQFNSSDTPLGVRLALSSSLRKSIIKESSGDQLDAILCALQLAAALKKSGNLGIPKHADPLEGWIVDPETV